MAQAATAVPYMPDRIVLRSPGQNTVRYSAESQTETQEPVAIWFVELARTSIPDEYTKLESSTAQFELPVGVVAEFKALFDAAKEESFEDGIETLFSRKLMSLVTRYRDIAVQILTDLLIGERVGPEVASETLRWLGQIEDPSSHHERLWLLAKCLLSCRSPKVRDGALLGLSFLEDPKAIPYVRIAIRKERVEELRHDMKQTLTELIQIRLEGR